ncbi:MAG: Threonine dehydratase [Parcubacteria group bacterium GW2011_GWA2_49_9]|nr:MAG: Threonine dehydratase [Parcubacteria group bacterium GW2011_GWA2_49_9]
MKKDIPEKLEPSLVEEAYGRIHEVIIKTSLRLNKTLSARFGATIYLKREDLQPVRSYKVRGAYNRISLLTPQERKKGVVCASAGNHAQGVAFSCAKLGIKGYIYMPKNTPRQKVNRVQALGEKWITLTLVGDNFDEAYKNARAFCDKSRKTFIHPFDDLQVIAGQGTIGIEILDQLGRSPDYVLVPIGGGGLISGLGSYLKFKDERIQVVGVEPVGAPSMAESLKAGKVVTLPKVDTFVDGVAVKTVGVHTFAIAKHIIDTMLLVPEGKVCQEMISLYQNDGLVTEPAGALSVAGLEQMKDKIKGKVVVCIVSGGNNDISRYTEVIERSLVYQGLKHYFVIEFSQRPGALRTYLNDVLGPTDDITFFEYVKKNNREHGPALVGIELAQKRDFEPLLKRMDKVGLTYELLKNDSPVFRFLM